MKKNFWFVLVVAVLVFSILACSASIDTGLGGQTMRGSGNVVEENRQISGVSAVQLTMQGTLHIVMGESESLSISAEDNLLEYIRTDVRGGTLEIGTASGTNLHNTKPIDYYLTVVKLDKIAITSSGDVEAGDLVAESFTAHISSSGNMTINNLDCDTLRVEITSSGNVEILGGQATQQAIQISSSGEYRARDMTSVEAEVTLTSSGSATIRVSDKLSGRLTSSGDVYYIGKPAVNVSTSSSGRAVAIE